MRVTDRFAPQYARNGDVRIAFQVIGGGPFDLVFVPGFVSNIELVWENPVFAHSRRRLSSFARAIYFDKRGTGLSDRDAGIPSLDERVSDLRAVMDAAGSPKAAFVGSSEGGPMSLLFAAMFPERVSALVLWDSFACLLRNDEQDWALDRERFEGFLDFVSEKWGTGEVLGMMAPSAVDDVRLAEWCGRYERLGASPGAALSLIRLAGSIDVRWVLESIAVPTLVLHRSGNPIIPVQHGQMLAAAIRDAALIELPGSDHVAADFEDDALDCIEEFLTGASASHQASRVLATVLFTDIVGSTDALAHLGDARWRAVLESQDISSSRVVSHHRGRIVKTTGDGILALFETPGMAIAAATEMHRVARSAGIEIRVGIHTGEVETRGDDISGMTVHIAARAMSAASGGDTLVTRTVTDLLAGSRQHFHPRGEYKLKGVPGDWLLFAATGEM